MSRDLYFPYPQTGLFNHKAPIVYSSGEIIVTKSILDAYSLLENDIKNVTVCYDTNGFKATFINVLKGNRIKNVVLAFDNEDGKTESEELKTSLLDEGFSVKQIFPGDVKNWNEFLLTDNDGSTVKELIHEAETFKIQKEDKTDFKVKKEQSWYIFIINQISYRCVGVKEIFVNTLKLNIRAEYEGQIFLDNCDLYSQRSRASFASHLSITLNVEAKRVENDLFRIIEYLEEERDKRLAEDGSVDAPVQITEEERKLAMEFLKNPKLLDIVVDDMTDLGLVGEYENKQLVYLAGTSRLLPKPLSVYVRSGASTGKSFLLDTERKLLPPECVIAVSSFSDQSLNYMREEDFLAKVMFMGEDVHSDLIQAYIRQMQSEGELARLVAKKDVKTGELVSKQIRNKVQMSFMLSSTAMHLNPENSSRCLLPNVDESSEQTSRVLAAQRRKRTFEGYLQKQHLVPKIIKKHHTAQRLLKPLPIFNSLAPYLRYPKSRPSMRRSQEQFLSLLEAICLLRQFQKERVVKTHRYFREKIEGIEIDLEDYRIGYELFTRGILIPNSCDLPTGAKILYEAIRKIVKKKAKKEKLEPTDVTFIQREVREASELGTDSVRKYIKSLTEYEYIQVTNGKQHGTRYCYRLREDKPIELLDVSLIPSPEEVKKKIEEKSSKEDMSGEATA